MSETNAAKEVMSRAGDLMTSNVGNGRQADYWAFEWRGFLRPVRSGPKGYASSVPRLCSIWIGLNKYDSFNGNPELSVQRVVAR